MRDLAALPSLRVRLAVTVTMRREGTYDLRGLLRTGGDTLLLDVRPVSASGEGDVTTHRLALEDVSAVDLQHGWLRSRLRLDPRRLGAVEGIPGVRDGRLVLTVARSERDLASEWATMLSLALLERDA